MNILTALILAMIVLCGFGDATPVISNVEEGSPAYEAGLRAGDQIVGINGQRIDFAMEFDTYTMGGLGDQVALTVQRGDETIDVIASTYFDEELNKTRMGIEYGKEIKKFSFFEGLALSFKWLYLIIQQMFVALGQLIFRGQGAADIVGPVGTVGLISSYMQYGGDTILRLAALLSINLGIVNLLPIPALDGGRLVFLGIEKIRRKPLPKNIEGYANVIGFFVLMGLIVLLTYRDIVRLVS